MRSGAMLLVLAAVLAWAASAFAQEGPGPGDGAGPATAEKGGAGGTEALGPAAQDRGAGAKDGGGSPGADPGAASAGSAGDPGETAGPRAFEQEFAFGRGDGAAVPAGRRASTELPLSGFFFWAVVVLFALVGALTVLRKVLQHKRWLGASEAIQVVGRRVLGPNQQLVLVEVGSRVLRIGLTKDSMVYLGETVDPDEVAAIKAKGQSAREGSSVAEFRGALQSASSDRPAEPSGNAERLGDVKRELASIRRAVQGWMS